MNGDDLGRVLDLIRKHAIMSIYYILDPHSNNNRPLTFV